MIRCSMNIRGNCRRKCFLTKDKETQVKFNPGLSANRSSNNWAPVSQWYVYPRDMCIPVHISLVISVSLQYGCQWNVYPLPPTPPNKCRFYFCCFCEFCESSSKGLQMIQDYEQHNRQKSNDSRQNNRKAVSGLSGEFTSLWAAMLT